MAAGNTRGPLDRRTILLAAITLIDEHDLRHLTMRTLGAQLGVEGMALYHYIHGREDLLDGIVELVIDDLYGDPEVHLSADHWQDYLQRLAHGVRRIALAHPQVFPLVATRPPAAPWVRPPLRSLRWMESFLDTLHHCGFTDAGCVGAYRAFSSFLLGHLLLEVSGAGRRHRPDRAGRPGRHTHHRPQPVPAAEKPGTRTVPGPLGRRIRRSTGNPARPHRPARPPPDPTHTSTTDHRTVHHRADAVHDALPDPGTAPPKPSRPRPTKQERLDHDRRIPLTTTTTVPGSTRRMGGHAASHRQEVTDTVQRIMGEDIAPPPAPVTTATGTPTSGDGSTTTTDVAKQQAAEVADTAKQAGAQVAGTVKEQAGQVTEEAKHQAKQLLSQAQSELSEQAASTQQRVSEGLHALADELTGMAKNSEQDGVGDRPGPAGRGQGPHQAAGWLADRDPGSLLERGAVLRPAQARHLPRARARRRCPGRPVDPRPDRPHRRRPPEHRPPDATHPGTPDLPGQRRTTGPDRRRPVRQPVGLRRRPRSPTRPAGAPADGRARHHRLARRPAGDVAP